MTYQEVEQKFRELEKQWAAGQLTREAYKETLKQMWFTGPDGNTWGIQMHTGRWFVLREGRWQAAVPPTPQPLPAQPKPAQARGVGQPGANAVPPIKNDARPAAAAAPGSREKKRIWLWAVAGLAAACLLCGLVGGAGYLIYNGTLFPGLTLTISGTPLPGPAAPQPVQPAQPIQPPKPMETVSAAPDGAAHADSRGVALVVPVDALETGEQVNMTSVDLQAPWSKGLAQVVRLDTPFYQLSASGKTDTPGSLSLSFPAGSPEARLLAVIDNEYLVELAQVPEGGKLTLETRAGPADASGIKLPEGYDGTGTIYYAVITPNASSRVPGGTRLAALHRAQPDERSCIPDISIIGGASLNLCRQNEAGTIQVMLPNALRELRPQADAMVDKIEAVMNSYSGLGFTTAALSKRSPMLVRVSAKIKDPSYYPANGVLYIPVDTVKNLATKSPTDVYHEMAHWIQAVKYSTLSAYWSQEKTWWLETAAENMVMLVEPGYLGGNLTEYGSITTPAETLAFQNEPYQWPNDFYIHAQLLKVNICDSATCPLSPASFAKAISEGHYPIDGAAKSLISNNLKDYAFYLLGKSPSAANTSISLSGPVHSGDGYGEFVQVMRDPNIDHKYTFNGRTPQMTMGTREGKETLEINAPLQRDSVYPLVIRGGEGKNPGLPVELVVEPGASFYYTLDDGDLKYSDGSQELTVRPIHGKMGTGKVRIVALGLNGGEVFKAHLQLLDLEGAWAVAITGNKTGGAVTCSDDSVDNPDGTAVLMGYILEVTGGMGDMKADPSGRNLDWSEAGRTPAEFQEAKVTFKGTALMTGEGIKIQAVVDVPRASEESSLPPALPLGLLASLPLMWLLRKHLGEQALRVVVNLIVIGSIALVSSGCFGMGMYGTSTLEGQFDKIEYVGGQDTGLLAMSKEMSLPQGQPLWKLSGTGSYDTVFNIETTVTGQDGKDTTEVTTCTGRVTYPITAFIYKDMTVTMPPSEE